MWMPFTHWKYTWASQADSKRLQRMLSVHKRRKKRLKTQEKNAYNIPVLFAQRVPVRISATAPSVQGRA
jgi:hypothetical protein